MCSAAARRPPARRATPQPGGTAMRIQGFAKTFVHSKPGLVPADLTKVEAISFVGPGYLRGFEVPDHIGLL